MTHQLLLSIIVFAAAAGSVVLVHTSPLPIPNMKPFNCAFCAIVWISWAIWSVLCWQQPDNKALNVLLAMAYPLYAGMLVGLLPWLFRSFPSTAQTDAVPTVPMPRGEDEESKNFDPTGDPGHSSRVK